MFDKARLPSDREDLLWTAWEGDLCIAAEGCRTRLKTPDLFDWKKWLRVKIW